MGHPPAAEFFENAVRRTTMRAGWNSSLDYQSQRIIIGPL